MTRNNCDLVFKNADQINQKEKKMFQFSSQNDFQVDSSSQKISYGSIEIPFVLSGMLISLLNQLRNLHGLKIIETFEREKFESRIVNLGSSSSTNNERGAVHLSALHLTAFLLSYLTLFDLLQIWWLKLRIGDKKN